MGSGVTPLAYVNKSLSLSLSIYIYIYITDAGLEQSRASVGAKAASVARNEEGKG